MKNLTRLTASTFVLAAGLGLAGLGAATAAQAQPPQIPDYHWCPGQQWDPQWGNNWDQSRCHDDHFRDGEPRDQGHWQGGGNFDPGWRP